MKVLVIAEQQRGLPHTWAGIELAKSGIQINFLFQNDSPAAALLREHGLKVETLPLRSRLDLYSLVRLRAILQELQPQVVHAYTAKTCCLAIMAQWLQKKTKVVFYRGASRRPSRWNPNDRLLFYSGWVDAYDCLSQAVADTLIKAGIAAEKMVVNYYGHRPEWYTGGNVPPEYERKMSNFRIGCVANYRRVKGLETLVDAADLLNAREIDFELVLAGRDREGILAKYVARASSRSRIRLAGPLQEPWALVRTFDCAVVPSLDEGLSKAALEALACGVPLVASAVGGLKEIVESGANGLLVPPGNPEQLANAIAKVLEDAPLRERFRTNGTRTLQQKFHTNQTRDRLISLYSRLLEL